MNHQGKNTYQHIDLFDGRLVTYEINLCIFQHFLHAENRLIYPNPLRIPCINSIIALIITINTALAHKSTWHFHRLNYVIESFDFEKLLTLSEEMSE